MGIRRRKHTVVPRNVTVRSTKNTVKRRHVIPHDFDWQIYLDSHEDLRRAGIVTKEQAEEHFLKIGHSENRIYSKSLRDRPNYNASKPLPARSGWLEEKLQEKKGVVFTCVSGSYDTLKEPLEVDPNWDYICFTDGNLSSKTWQIRSIPTELSGLPAAKVARAIKILPHIYLSEYDYSFWVDASILIKRAVTPYVAMHFRNESCSFSIPKHPDRICIYEEGRAVARMKKDAAHVVQRQMDKYKADGYPSNWGLVQSGLIIRQKTEKVSEFCNRWWKEVKEGSKRDQLSFNYVLWKYQIQIRVMNPAEFGGMYFHLYSHRGKKEPFAIKFRKDYGRLENYINGKRV